MKQVLDFIKKYYPFILAIIIVVLSIMYFQTSSTLSKERKDRTYQEQLDKQNLNAFKDSITVNFNKKLQAYEFTKDNYVVQKLSDLEKYNKSLSDELKKVKGDVIAAIKSEVQGDLGGISSSNNLVILDPKTNYYGLKFHTNYTDSGFVQDIKGTSKFYAVPNLDSREWNIKPDATVLDTNLTTIRITYGFKDLKNKYQVFAISPSSKIKLTDLTGGYFIDKQPTPPPVKPKKWGIGPYIGVGLNSDTKFNPTFGYSIGVSLHYSILQW
jgi:hypothetical protein